MSALPELASLRNVLRILLIAELLALVLVLGRHASVGADALEDLARLSVFVLAIALAGAVTLRLAAPWLARLSATVRTLLVLVLLLIVAAAVTEAAVYALYWFGAAPERWPAWRGPLLLRSLVITGIVGLLVLRYLALEQRSVAGARTEQEAQMQALQSRIRPHFLFNSLNSVASLTRSDPTKAEAVLHDLADLFRVLLADARKLVPMAAEREIARQYIELEKLRLGDRLQVKWAESNVPRGIQIPALTLQPLLENAIYHGIEPRFGGGTIKIELWSEGDALNIMISNPLPETRSAGHQRGNKIAMDNIRQRLVTQFGESATLQAFEQGGQYHVKLKLPLVKA
jgi:two-component system sensor histidine kinase AlgZ